VATPANPTRTDIDLDRPGKQYGHIFTPDSRNDGAWSQLATPVVVVGDGDGPSALVLAGNHGDEYEGQLAVMRLAQDLDAQSVHGRLIIVPCLSLRASRASTRLWPSGANFNRLFDGRPGGEPERLLADYVATSLFPRVDTVFDIHSGGRSLLFHPMTTMTHDRIRSGDVSDQRRRMVDAMLTWNADYHMSYAGSGQSGLLPEEAERQGKVVITGEMGGGGISTRAIAERASQGLRNVLRHLGLLHEPVRSRADLDQPDTVILRSDGPDNYVLAPVSGLFEPLVDPGERVTTDQPVGRVHFPERPDWRPEIVTTRLPGVVAAVRPMPSCIQGDALFSIGEVCTRADVE
jgi:N-alpha-acetyl-L-2,4-diaminobutyrate deacetylase